jgi:hypothetical protein
MTPEPSSKMYFSVVEASPKKGTEAFARYGGAHIACWVNTVDWTTGREKVVSLIEGNGWMVKSVQEEKTISAEDYRSDDQSMQLFRQALTDGEVCVIYTFPK